MKNLIDITKIDLRFEQLRLKNPKAEGILLASISERGVEDPVGGILSDDRLILLDGFKRYRCALKCKITELPYTTYGSDETLGVITLLKISNDRSLHILEQAKIVRELVESYKLKVSDIAAKLSKSNFWVRMRITLLSEVTPYCLQKIFEGSFPAWCALGKLRQLKRYYQITNQGIDEFVETVSGKYLSCREIDLLAQGYFSGFLDKKQIAGNDFKWAVDKMKRLSLSVQDLGSNDQQSIRELEIVQKYMGRVIVKSPRWNKNNSEFMSMATILAEGILSKIDSLGKTLHNFIKDFSDEGSGKK